MKSLILLGCFSLLYYDTIAQKCRADFRKTWYANVFTENEADQDTFVLYNVIDSVDRKKNIMRWEYLKCNKFRPVYDYKKQGALTQPTYMSIIKWQRKKDILVFKRRNWQMKYRAEYYCDDDRLYKLVLIRDKHM